MTEDPGSGQSPRRTGRPVDAEDPTSGLGSPFEPNATSSLREIDAAITSLRAGEGDMAAPNPWLDRLELRSQNPAHLPVPARGRGRRPPAGPDRGTRRAEPLRGPAGRDPAVAPPAGACLSDERARQLPALPSRRACRRRAPATADRGPPRAPPVLGPAPTGHQGDARRAACPDCLVLGVGCVRRRPRWDRAFGGRGRSPKPKSESHAIAVAPVPETSPTPSPEPTPTPTPTPDPTPDAHPDTQPRPRRPPRHPPRPRPPTPKPTATAKPAGDPILARFPELHRCPNRSNCYVYVVEPGNNLVSIANYYRVSYDRVLQMNPQITNPANIHAGDQVRMPTPQRKSR